MMRKISGILIMILGAALIFGALSLFVMNQQESLRAGEFSDEILSQMKQEISNNLPADVTDAYLDNVPVEMLKPEDLIMTEKLINGYMCIGYVSIPDMNLELPVITDWDYQKLEVAPCRFSGTVRGEDLVIMAHSYNTHFGRLSTLSEGSEVYFTDMDGKVWCYQVAALDVLDPTAVEEMTAGEYDLTLFTCTTTSRQRITVRCDLVDK